MTDEEIAELKNLYNKVLTPAIAKIMCDRLDELNKLNNDSEVETSE